MQQFLDGMNGWGKHMWDLDDGQLLKELRYCKSDIDQSTFVLSVFANLPSDQY